MKTVTVIQGEKEVPADVLADAILVIAAGVQKLRAGKLNDKALVLLIQHAAPAIGSKYQQRRVGAAEVRAVLDGMEGLEAAYLKKRPVKA